jgi:hypothetical protein
MIITVEGKTAKVEIGIWVIKAKGSSSWNAVNSLLSRILTEYSNLSRVDEVDLNLAALERKKLLQEIVE